MKEWFQGLQQQEKMTIISGGVVLAIMLFYVAIWEPLHDGVDALKKDVARQGPLLEWMKQAAADADRLKKKGGTTRAKTGQSLLSLIDSSAKRSGLGNALKRVKPDGNDKVRVWLEDASFNKSIKWIEELDKTYAIQVSTLVVDRKETPGMVDSRIVFIGP